MNPTQEQVDKLNALLDRGLCRGKGNGKTTFCVEQAVSIAMGEPLSDNPRCVHPVVAAAKRYLNDGEWSSTTARAEGMRAAAIAELGSQKIDGIKFSRRYAELTICRVLPIALRAIGLSTDAERCEREGSRESAATAAWAATRATATAAGAAMRAAGAAMRAAWAATQAVTAAEAIGQATWAAWAATAEVTAAEVTARATQAATRAATRAARAAARVAEATAEVTAAEADKILALSAELIVEILVELDSPGVQFLGVEL